MESNIIFNTAFASDASNNNQWSSLMPFLLIMLVFYFLLIRPQQKKAKEHQEFLKNLKKGDDVVTVGGMMGKVTLVKDDDVTIEVSEGVKIKFKKSSIAEMSVEKQTKSK